MRRFFGTKENMRFLPSYSMIAQPLFFLFNIGRSSSRKGIFGDSIVFIFSLTYENVFSTNLISRAAVAS